MTSALPDGSGLRHCRMVSNWPRVPAKTAFATGKLYSGSRALFLQVKDVSYRSPGTEVNILNNVNLDLPQKSLGLIFGRSGSGKTTLLQVLAGLLAPSEGIVSITSPLGDDGDRELEFGTTGIVFQFPERYFLTETVVEELTFGLSSRSQNPLMTHQLYIQLHQVALAVGLMGIPWDANPRSLSDGYKRRLALAAQLVRRPRLLLLDEPLAGLAAFMCCWKRNKCYGKCGSNACSDVVERTTLQHGKKQQLLIGKTLIDISTVSKDLDAQR